MSRKKIKTLIGLIVVVAIIAYIIYDGMRDTMIYYLTVSELLSKEEKIYGEKLRLGGKVVEDSVNWDSLNQKLKFKISDGKEMILVSYQGIVPDTFKPGEEVVVEGNYTTQKIFQAVTLMPKCPSKYRAKIK